MPGYISLSSSLLESLTRGKGPASYWEQNSHSFTFIFSCLNKTFKGISANNSPCATDFHFFHETDVVFLHYKRTDPVAVFPVKCFTPWICPPRLAKAANMSRDPYECFRHQLLLLGRSLLFVSDLSKFTTGIRDFWGLTWMTLYLPINWIYLSIGFWFTESQNHLQNRTEL